MDFAGLSYEITTNSEGKHDGTVSFIVPDMILYTFVLLQRKRNFEETKHSGQQALATLRKQTATKDTAKSATSRQKVHRASQF